jgi:hypothetical protein
LLPCTAGTSLSVLLNYGTVSTGLANHNLLSWTAFPYIPSNVAPTSWAAYRSTLVNASSAAVSPVTFDVVQVSQGGVYNSNTGTVTIQNSGYYYLYISTAAFAGKRTYMSLYRQSAQGVMSKLFGIYRSSTLFDNFETLGAGRIMLLSAGDVLSVTVELGYTAYSNNVDYQISFFGMLLYYA